MTDRTQIPDTELAADKPVTFQVAREMRDNTTIASWEFYDGVDGILWDHSVDGNTATVVTPSFDDGYEYLLDFVVGTASTGTGPGDTTRTIDLDVQLDAYSPSAVTILTDDVVFSSAAAFIGQVYVPRPRLPRQGLILPVSGSVAVIGSGGTLSNAMAASGAARDVGISLASNDAIDTITLRANTPSTFVDGMVRLYRRTANDGNTV